MHPDKKINYKIPDDCILEQLCFDSFEKVMKLQQQGNPNNHVVFDCQDGDSVYMSNRGRGINQYPSGVQVELEDMEVSVACASWLARGGDGGGVDGQRSVTSVLA